MVIGVDGGGRKPIGKLVEIGVKGLSTVDLEPGPGLSGWMQN